jgi:glycosyltransferase involved in cell wall biosynthesis
VPEMNVATWLPALVIRARKLVAERSFDCLVTTSPPESSHLLGLLLGTRRPAWLADFRDGWTFEPYREPFPTATQRRLDRALEWRVVQTANVVVGATRPIANDLMHRAEVDAHWVTNGWAPPVLSHTGDRVPPWDEFAGRTLVYTGTLWGDWGRDPAPLLEALSIVRGEEDVPPLRLVHAGRLRSDERELIERAGVEGAFVHLGTLDRGDAISLQRSADALVLITSRNSSEATGKLFEYLASGRPILALADGNEAARIVEETGTGITVPPDDVCAIAAALRRVAFGELAEAYAPHGLERFMYPGPAERMAELIEEAISRHARRG